MYDPQFDQQSEPNHPGDRELGDRIFGYSTPLSLDVTDPPHPKGRYDNKVRLSSDVLAKAELIAQEWGLKNARAAVEAVFRKYSDRYLQEHSGGDRTAITLAATNTLRTAPPMGLCPPCEALDALEDLLRM
jgi:hypothetical protein